MIKKIIVSLVFLAGVSLLYKFFFSSTKDNASNNTHLQTIRIGNAGEPPSLDPQIAQSDTEHNILQNLFEPLVDLDPQTLALIPAAAESWKIAPNGKVLTFKLRKGAVWSNGDPVVAGDFVYTFRRLVSPSFPSTYSSAGFLIKNGEKVNAKKLPLEALGVKALNDYTLQVELERPYSFFINFLFHTAFYPVHQKTVETYKEAWVRPEHMVSNGPYVLKTWKIHDVIEMEKNPKYWDSSHVKMDKAYFYPSENSDTEERMYKSHELDTTSTIIGDHIEAWKKDTSGSLRIFPYFANEFYVFNTLKPPLNNIKVRQALNYAIDRDSLVKFVTKGGETPAAVFVPYGILGYVQNPMLPVDSSLVGKAKQLLKEAGYPNGFQLELIYNTNEQHKKNAETIQSMLKKNIGVELTIVNQEWKVALGNRERKNFQVLRMGWIGDYVEPYSFLELFLSKSTQNASSWYNKKYDELINLAQEQTDTKKKMKLYWEAEKILLTELPMMPLYIESKKLLINPKLKGWYPNLLNFHPLKYQYFEM